jgi:signal transduction histidine kinase
MIQSARLASAETRTELVRHAAWAALLLLTLVAVGFTGLAAVAGYPPLLAPCLEPADTCRGLDRLTPEQVSILADSGLPPAFHAAFLTLQLVLERGIYWVLAALILWRRPQAPLAFLTALMLMTTGNTAHYDTVGTLYPALWWPSQVLNMVGQMSWLWLFCFLPNGRLTPRWLLWVALLHTLLTAFVWLAPASPLSPMVWPVGVRVVVLLSLYAAVIGGMVWRYRHNATVVERQQIKWLGLGFATSALLLAVVAFRIFVLEPPFSPLYYAHRLLFFLSGLCVPVALAVVILRHNLFSLDLVVNRTLVYGSLTAVVVALYAGVVGAMSLVFQGQGNLLISLLAAGLVAVLFQPLRERLQRGVNRLVYGRRDEPYAVLTRLSRQLATTLAPDAVLPAVVQAIRETLRLPYAAIELQRGDGSTEIAAGAGTAPLEQQVAFPLHYQGDLLGTLRVAPRSGETTLSRIDRRLLDDLAQQAGSAMHAARLTVELQRSRAALVAAREEERRRLRRDLHDGLGPSLATMTIQADTARGLVRSEPEEAEALLSDLTEQAQTTMREVRQLIHGLRPPALDDLGLAGALDALVRGFQRPGLAIALDSQSPLGALPAAVEVAAYRIVQEALTNVVRHARAQHCLVALTQGEALDLRIEDDGIGLADGSAPGVGLRSMRERAEEVGGWLSIFIPPGQGTCIEARLPLEAAHGTDPGSDR